VIKRGLRFGLVVGLVCALGWGALCLVGFAVGLVAGRWHDVLVDLVAGLGLVGGSLAVGALLGLMLGAALALAPGWLARCRPLRGILGGLVAGTLFLGEVIVIAVASDVGPLPTLLTMAAAPVVGAVAAVHSGDIAGFSHHHDWLWARPAWADFRAMTWRGSLKRLIKLLWS
jgi:hypothetical protein